MKDINKQGLARPLANEIFEDNSEVVSITVLIKKLRGVLRKVSDEQVVKVNSENY